MFSLGRGCTFVFLYSCSRIYFGRFLYYSLVLLLLCFDLLLIFSCHHVFILVQWFQILPEDDLLKTKSAVVLNVIVCDTVNTVVQTGQTVAVYGVS